LQQFLFGVFNSSGKGADCYLGHGKDLQFELGFGNIT
jgi:hypothetical protein